MTQDNSMPLPARAFRPTTPSKSSGPHPYTQGTFKGQDGPMPPEEPGLTREDLINNPDHMGTIRTYMSGRFGHDFEYLPEEEVVDRWLAHRRFLEMGNEIALFDEYRYLSRGNDKGDHSNKMVASANYKLYDQFEPFQTAEIPSAVADGVTALLFSPTSYLGFGAMGLIKGAGVKGLQTAVSRAAAETIARGGSREATEAAVTRALQEATKAQGRRAAVAAGVAEGAGQANMDYWRQEVRSRADPDYEFNLLDFGIAATGGAIGGVMDAATMFANRSGATGLLNVSGIRSKPTKDVRAKIDLSAASSVAEGLRRISDNAEWMARVANGEAFIYNNEIIAPEVLDSILNTKPGIGLMMYKAGFNPEEFDRTTAAISQFFKEMTPEAKAMLQPRIEELFQGTPIQSVDDFADALPKSLRQAGQEFQIISNVSKSWSRALAGDLVAGATNDVNESVLKSPKYGKLLLNTWRRLVVSHPGTSALNAQGSIAYAAGQSAADLLSAGFYLTKAGANELAARATPSEALRTGLSAEAFENAEKARAIGRILKYRAKTALTFTENNQIMSELINLSPAQFDQLKSVSAMGTETLERFDLEQLPPNIREMILKVDGGVDKVQAAALVKMQDTYFKSWGVVDNLNRIAELKYGTSLDELISSGNFRALMDGDDFGEAVHRTLKQTFSADYTVRNKRFNEASAAMRWVAETAETISNGPLGFALPFGRFMANQLANAGEWTISSAVHLGIKGEVPTVEKISKNLVGLGVITGMMEYQRTKVDAEGRALSMYEMEMPNGAIVNMENNYPFSFMLVAGEALRQLVDDGIVSPDVGKEFARQIAIGQAVTDLSPVFGNLDERSSTAFQSVYTLFETGETGGLRPDADVALQTLSGIAAGITRPADMLNDFGFLAGADLTMRDRRQAEGFAENINAEMTRYTENILEAYQKQVLGENPDLLPRQARFEPTGVRPSQEANVVASNVFGVRVEGPRTPAESVFALAGVPGWKANVGSRIGGYRRLVHEEIAAELNLLSEKLLDPSTAVGGRYLAASQKERRNMLVGSTGRGGYLGNVKQSVIARINGALPSSSFGLSAGRHRISQIKSRTPELFNDSARAVGLQGQDIRNMSATEVYTLEKQIERNRWLDKNGYPREGTK